MELYVSTKINENKLIGPAENYIFKAKKFEVEPIIRDMKLGLLKNTYELKLKGSDENIKSFLSYLNAHGFQIKSF